MRDVVPNGCLPDESIFNRGDVIVSDENAKCDPGRATKPVIPVFRASGAAIRRRCPFFCGPMWERLDAALHFTRREADIARLLHGGESQDEIAAALGRRKPTVHNQVTRLYEKVNVSGGTEFVGLLCQMHNDLLCQYGPPPGCPIVAAPVDRDFWGGGRRRVSLFRRLIPRAS
jgi:DNA-binding CsgD family transcriptional regulator